MPSSNKHHVAEMEAGIPLIQEDGTVNEKGQAEETASPRHSRPNKTSRPQRILLAILVFALVGFTFLRGAALMTVVCMHGHGSQLATQAELEDDALAQALGSMSPEELCKAYSEYCPDNTSKASEVDDEDDMLDSLDMESSRSGSFAKRQESGSNNTASPLDVATSSESLSESTSVSTVSETTTVSQSSQESETSTQALAESTSSSVRQSSSTSEDEVTSSRPASTQRTTVTSPTSSERESTSIVTSSVVETSTVTTSERPSSSRDVEETPSSGPSSSSRRTVRTGTVTTSSAERHTYTSTLANGAATLVTSTAWVDYVPAEATGSPEDPDLQSSSSGWQRNALLQLAMGVLVGGILMV